MNQTILRVKRVIDEQMICVQSDQDSMRLCVYMGERCIPVVDDGSVRCEWQHEMALIERAASLQVLRKLSSIWVFYALLLTVLAQKTLSVITYSREELLDIRETSTYQHNQHYNQEYDFPKADPLSATLRAFELIPEADPKQRHQRKGCRSGLLVRLRIRA
jgi:hypothetical protein